MKKASLLTLSFLFFLTFAQAQMQVDGRTLYGNEWINYDQTYYKIPVAKDGIYRIEQSTLENNGILLSEQASRLQLFHLGEEVPIYIGENYIEFYGRQNRGELDRFLYENGEADMLNPDYSLITDTAAYFLTVAPAGTQGLRYTDVPNDLTDLPAPEAWYWAEEVLTSNSFVQKNINAVNESHFQAGEGYGFPLVGSRTLTFRPDNAYQPLADIARFELRVVSRGASVHELEVSLNDSIVYSENFGGYQLREISFLNTTEALSPNETVIVRGVSGEGSDRYGIGSAKLIYPRRYVFDNRNAAYFKIIGDGTRKYLEIERFSTSGAAPVLYDLTTQTRKTTSLENGTVRIVLEPFTGEKEFYLVDPATSINVLPYLEIRNFSNYQALDGDYLIITSKKLRGNGQEEDQVEAYAEYRRSTGFNPVILEVEDLYDAFAYGIQRHPLAIRNLANFAAVNWSNPRFILLLGKGRTFNEIRQYTPTQAVNFFVPTFGSPGSDNLLVAAPNSQMPVIPIGRIAATKPSDIELYLNKLRDYENPVSQAAEDRQWRKQVIHLGGGKTPGEQASIENNMNAMRDILTSNDFGADVHTFYKQSTDVVQRLDSEQINELLQQGVGMITFFGHGGPSIIDISIGDPATYTNYGKYPVMFALGCESGNLHFNGTSYSENFVFQPNRAGIAFIGTAAAGFIGSLGSFQRDMYNQLGNDFYGKSLGEAMQATIRLHNSDFGGSQRMLTQQYTLHGDPAIVISPITAPDYLVERERIQFSPANVNVQRDSFDLSFNVLNVGKNIQENLTLEIVRELPNGDKTTLYDTIPTPAYRSEPLSYRFPVGGANAVGFNRFYIELDQNNAIVELPSPEAEFNNELTDETGNRGIQLYIFDEGVTPIEPLPFAIVNAPPVTLAASTGNVFEREQRYLMQIDTTAEFNSLLRRDTAFFTVGGLLTWQPRLPMFDSTVYYWRIAVDSIVGNDRNWQTSSFTYLPNRAPGWRQGHYFQFLDNDFSSLDFSQTDRQLQFSENSTDLQFSIFQYPLERYSSSALYNYASINNTTNQYVGIPGGGVIVCVFNDATGDPWINRTTSGKNGRFGSIINETWASPLTSFPFPTTNPENRKKFIDFVNDTIPDGHYVFLYTIQHQTATYEPEEWAQDTMFEKTLMDVLAENGATQIQQAATEGARPYAIFYRKGRNTPLFFEELAPTVNDTVFGSIAVPGFKDKGSMTSQRIGPAKNWERLQQQFEQIEAADTYAVDVYGFSQEGDKTLLIEAYTGSDTSLNQINAADYPYLELQYSAQDSVQRNPVQFGYWQVLYEGLPEAALNPLTSDFQFKRDRLQEGEPLQLDISIANISQYDMDSLLVHFTIISGDNRMITDSMRLAPLPRQESLVAHFEAATKGLIGKNQLLIEVNPDEDQPELSHFNNVGSLEFFVEGDLRNPLIDVMFDGIRIMNGDLVSAQPQIIAVLQDENKYLSLFDTANIQIALSYPEDSGSDEPRRIPADSLQFEFKKNDKGSSLTIFYAPAFKEDGTYTLYVNGQDASGNRAGRVDFQVDFEVITDSKISNVLNYPNPFSSSTQFVYTLTGVEPPSHYQIQIMTISGRIVRELTELDLGPLKIGTHRTEYAWDGTDMYGDRLANGVYLYRMIIKDQDGNNLEKYDNGTNRFFRNNMGKLVILR